MNPAPNESTADDDPRLLRAAQEYLAELEAGRRPDRRTFAARFPGLDEALAPYLDALDAVHAASPPRSSEGSPVQTAGGTYSDEPLGDFRILREIGRGGMGVVYEAVQLSLGRRVALKVLPFAAALDAKQLQRFKNEAQAAAHLHHTNIVPVYAVGSERGVHFYAMQLIKGQNLASLIEDLRRATPGEPSAAHRPSSEPTGPFPPAAGVPAADTKPGPGAQFSTQRFSRPVDFFRTAARLAAQAAEGLDYAHGVGVIHRDVKPANLLVDNRGNVWVTDFGLAQFHADLGLTQTGDLVGTLRYMSPEQAGGQRVLIDARTDLYSLGATLYELLTLRPIFDGGDRRTLLHQILHEEPPAPRSVDPSIPPELETVVLKAVAKVPAERYATAGDFADDLRRFLRHEPIRARRATVAQRARKWLRRHPSVLVAVAVLLVLLAAGSLVSAWLIRGEQEKTRLAYERERQHGEEAEERFRLARRSVDDMIQLAEEELADSPHQQGLRKRLLESALAYYQEFIEQRREDAAAQAELAATRDRVKKFLGELAVLQGAGHLYLLNFPPVVDDLRPAAGQQQRLADLSRRLAEQWFERFGDFHRITPEQRRQRFLALARANEAAAAAVLSPGQLRRLEQIALQLRGPAAFRDPDVAAALKLTPNQRDRIRAIEADMFLGMSDWMRPGKSSPDSSRQRCEQMRISSLDKIQKLLTEEQARRWQETAGEPFTMSVQPANPAGPR